MDRCTLAGRLCGIEVEVQCVEAAIVTVCWKYPVLSNEESYQCISIGMILVKCEDSGGEASTTTEERPRSLPFTLQAGLDIGDRV